MSGLDALEDLRMRQKDELRRALLLGVREAQRRPLGQQRASATHLADPELRALQIAQNADGARILRLERAHRGMQLFDTVVRRARVAHVEPEHIDTGNEQPLDYLRIGRGRPESCNDLDPPGSSHFVLAPLSPGSVSRIVQSLDSPVSTSKNPVFLNPRVGQSCTPRIVNDLSCVHMNDCPAHSPPRS
jgi:hypothetical protein